MRELLGVKGVQIKIYFEPKVIEVINTKIEGSIRIDEKTGLKYATNEQIIKDTSITKNEYTKNIWMQMLSRYKNIKFQKL